MVAHSRAPVRVDRLRALNRPRPVKVELDERGRPKTVQDGPGRSKSVEDGQRRWQVETIGEIWRVDDEWWRQPVSRRYVEVSLEGGKHVTLFEDLATGEWFIQQI